MVVGINVKMAEKDVNEVFDDIFMAEEHLIKAAYDDGYRNDDRHQDEDGDGDGDVSAARKKGYQIGYNIGKEIGFYFEFTEVVVDRLSNSRSSVKVEKVFKQFQSLLHKFPVDNCESVDIYGLLERVRNQYAMLCLMLKMERVHFNDQSISFWTRDFRI